MHLWRNRLRKESSASISNMMPTRAHISEATRPFPRISAVGRFVSIFIPTASILTTSTMFATSEALVQAATVVASLFPNRTQRTRQVDSEATDQPTEPKFEPYKGKIRKPGTGCVTMINDHLYEGRFSPRVNGKRIAKNIYATTREECEEKLKVLIAEMKKEIAEIKANAKNEG